MLKITVPGVEVFDIEKQEFSTVGDVDLELEHSLVSLSKWESKFEKPFLGDGEKSPEELLEYIRCMTLNFPRGEVSDEVFQRLTEENIKKIYDYIGAKMTATWFEEQPGAPKSREIITSELIYYWLVAFQIPFEAENWHLNRLFTLIRVCNLKNAKPQEMSRAEIARRNRELNAQRKAQLGTKG